MVDKGLLRYDANVVDYWPEFGQNGKDSLKLEDILRHEGGLTTFKHSFQWDQFLRENIKENVIGKVIESCKAEYPAGHCNPDGTPSKRSYHAVTRGFVLNEIVRRVDPKGRTIGEICSEDLELEDLYCGIDDNHMNQITMLDAKSRRWVVSQSVLPYFLGSKVHVSFPDLYNLVKYTQGNRERLGPQKPSIANMPKDPWLHHTVFEQTAIRKGEIPSANFHGNARSLAKLASAMANKGQCADSNKRMFSEITWEKMHAAGKWAADALLGNNFKFTFSDDISASISII